MLGTAAFVVVAALVAFVYMVLYIATDEPGAVFDKVKDYLGLDGGYGD